MASMIRRAETWNMDLDRYINRIVPPSPLHRLPSPISRFLGYRKEQRQDIGNVLGAFWSFMGAFCGLAVIAAVFNNTGSIQMHRPPVLIASFGASAVLEYNAIRSPLGQPRNALLGHTFSTIIGVSITKLFLYHSEFEKVRWIAGAISCGVASAVMLLTGTVHPPGGASAVLAATSPEITEMGWYFVGLVMWGTTLMLIVGLVINNIQRQFPMYWWTPLPLRETRRDDVEVGPTGDGGLEEKDPDLQEDGPQITVSAAGVMLPENLALNSEEAKLLEQLRVRLGRKQSAPSERSVSSGSTVNMTMVPSHTASNLEGDIVR
ncbi:HPP-domain-containing protein [Bimuria novae-zelandiae CBS 107.79]|uniref:HPP-domain-containing protein n=1 Tax=Bimuria novae-zelandiae CBS 107.79 TaxID=1447943 RepID=A0A6A5VMK8_9PLEO|nr:HPP-domain-containing protein [Bimuria novae-zelandiae CBS 107.79]